MGAIVAAACLRDILALLFVLAAGAKAVDLRGFGRTLAGLGLHWLPTRSRTFLAASVAAAEATLALITVAQVAVPQVNIANVAIAGIFALATASALLRGITVHCRCFGALSGTAFSAQGLFRSAVLLLIAVAAAMLGNPGLTFEPYTTLALASFVLVGVASSQASAVLATIIPANG